MKWDVVAFPDVFQSQFICDSLCFQCPFTEFSFHRYYFCRFRLCRGRRSRWNVRVRLMATSYILPSKRQRRKGLLINKEIHCQSMSNLCSSSRAVLNEFCVAAEWWICIGNDECAHLDDAGCRGWGPNGVSVLLSTMCTSNASFALSPNANGAVVLEFGVARSC